MSTISKPILYYDEVCMNALTAHTLCLVCGLVDDGLIDLQYTSLVKGDQLKPEYVAKFPLHHIPALQVSEDVYFDESATILRYLANAFPDQCGNKYYPNDPIQRALVERAMDWRNTEYMPALTVATYGPLWKVPYKMFTDPEVVQGAVAQVNAALEYLGDHLLGSKKFIAGDAVSLAEFHIIPSLATIRPFDGTDREMIIPPRVEQWIQDFYKACPQVLETQKKVQIPHMSNMHEIFVKEFPKKE